MRYIIEVETEDDEELLQEVARLLSRPAVGVFGFRRAPAVVERHSFDPDDAPKAPVLHIVPLEKEPA